MLGVAGVGEGVDPNVVSVEIGNDSVFLEGVVYLQGGLRRKQKPAHGSPAPLSH